MEQLLKSIQLLCVQNANIWNFNLGNVVKKFHFEVIANFAYLDT